LAPCHTSPAASAPPIPRLSLPPPRPPPTSTLFPYTTLFRSLGRHAGHELVDHCRLQQRFVALDVDDQLSRVLPGHLGGPIGAGRDRKSTRLNSSHGSISYAVFCLKKKKRSKHRCRVTHEVDN